MKSKPIRRLSLFLVAIFLSLAVLAGTTLTTFAGSDIDGDSHESGAAFKGGEWREFLNGARLTAISAVDGTPTSRSIDWVTDKVAGVYTKFSLSSVLPKINTFCKTGAAEDTYPELVCKQDYLKGVQTELEWVTGGYRPYAAPSGMPKMIRDDDPYKTGVAAIRAFFTDKNVLAMFCANVFNLDYSSLPVEDKVIVLPEESDAQKLYNRFLSGDYLLAIEPILFFYWNGEEYGGSATEVAILSRDTDAKYRPTNTNIYYLLRPESHVNAPDGIFLSNTHPELGYDRLRPAYHYKTALSGKQVPYYTDDEIIYRCLGIGIVWFEEPAPKVYYHLYTSTRTPDKTPTEMDSLSLAEQLANSKETKHEWTCLNPDGTTPKYEKIPQGSDTKDVYFATNDSQLTALLEAHKWPVNNTPTLPYVIGAEALEKAVDKSNLDPYPTADVLAQYLSSGVDVNNPLQLKYKDSDQGLGKKKDSKDVKEYHVAVYAIKWDLPKIDLYYHILTVTEDPSGDPDDTTMEWEQTKREIEAQPSYDPTTDKEKPEGNPVGVLGYPKDKKVEDDGTPEYPQQDKDGNPPEQRKPNEEIDFDKPSIDPLPSGSTLIIYPPTGDPINEIHVAMGYIFFKN